MKTLKRILIGLVVLIVIAVFGVFWAIDNIAKTGVEQGTSYALGVPTQLRSMSVGILRGRVALSGLNIANPDGFETSHFFAMDEGRVAVSLGTLRQDTVKVPELTLTGLDMNLETKGTTSNYKVIMDNLKKLDSGEEKQTPEGGSAKKFVIEKLLIENIDVNVKTIGLGDIRPNIPLHIARIELDGVGSGGGVSLSKLSGILIKAILDSVTKYGGDVLPKELVSELTADLSQLKNLQIGNLKVGEISTMLDGKKLDLSNLSAELKDKVNKQLDEAGAKLKDNIGQELQKGIGGLLGGDKADQESKDDGGD